MHQVDDLVVRYHQGATVYDLAQEFGINRRTASLHLKRRGVPLRRQPASPQQITKMVQLYRAGLSLAKVGVHVGFSADAVRKHLQAEGVVLRDQHGRERS